MEPADKANRAWGAARILLPHRARRPTGPDDLQPEDLGLHLKRRGTTIAESDMRRDYGLFLGHFEGEWVVGVKDLDWTLGLPMAFVGTESFGTLEALKAEWTLD